MSFPILSMITGTRKKLIAIATAKAENCEIILSASCLLFIRCHSSSPGISPYHPPHFMLYRHCHHCCTFSAFFAAPGMDIGKNIRKFRIAAGLTQKELARQVLVNSVNIAYFENGDKIPSIPTLVRIADILNCSIDKLLDRK